jgi:serine/threonine protein kinase
MLSSIDLKSDEPNWTTFQNRAIDDAFRIRDFLGGDERSAAFTARPLGDPDTNAVIRIYPVNDDSAAEKQIGLWLRAKELEHPNLVRILGAGRVAAGDDSLIYVALEPADERLGNVLAERRLEPGETAEILKSVASALERLHANGLVHGAVSADQIFAVGDAIKLSSENIRPAGSHEDVFADTPKFLAPESQGVNGTAAADVWCLGATIYQCLTQEFPDGSEYHHTTLTEPHRSIMRRALDPDPRTRGTLEEIIELERGKRAAVATVAVAAPAEPAETTAPAEPATKAVNPTAAATEKSAAEAAEPAVPKPLSEPVTPPPVLPPPARNRRPPVLETPHDTKPPREGFPVWAYGAGIVVIVLGLIFLLRPKHAAQKPASTPAASVPSAQQKVIPPAAESAAATRGGNAAAPSRTRSKPSPQVRSQASGSPASAAASNGAVWRVICYTYNSRGDAERQAEAINGKHPNLKPEVFSPSGNGAPFLVVVGGGMSRDEAKRFRQTAVSSGMPRDSYLQNFTH